MSGVFILLDLDQTGSGTLIPAKGSGFRFASDLASERPEKFSWLSEFEHAKLPRMSDEEVLGLARRLAPHLVEGVWSVRDKYVCLAARVAQSARQLHGRKLLKFLPTSSKPVNVWLKPESTTSNSHTRNQETKRHVLRMILAVAR